jgi:hypothetical protein
MPYIPYSVAFFLYNRLYPDRKKIIMKKIKTKIKCNSFSTQIYTYRICSIRVNLPNLCHLRTELLKTGLPMIEI